MSTTKDRRPYLTATTIDQDLLDEMASNLTSQIEFVVDITAPDATIIRASNRNKYIDGVFYRAILSDVPSTMKTLGEWLQPGLEFSSITIPILNVDGSFNRFAPGGADYGDWTGLPLEVRVGLFDIGASYKTIFSGFVTDIAGFARTQDTINITARDRYDTLNGNFPTFIFNNVTYPDIEDSLVGVPIPVVYGDFVTATRTPAMIPVFPVNTFDLNVIGGPDGSDDLKRNDIQYVVSINDNRNLPATGIYYRVSDIRYVNVPSADITNISVGKNSFDLKQLSTLWVPEPDGSGGEILVGYKFSSGDEFLCLVEGKDLGGVGFDDNLISMAKDILKTYGGVVDADFDANFETFRLKSSPPQSAIANIPGRAWVQEQQSVLEYSLQLMEQIRLEFFIERSDQKIKINSLHFEDISTVNAITINNWDVARKSLGLTTSDTHFINKAQGIFDQNPALDENNFKTEFYQNTLSIAASKEVEKAISFPNLYVKSDVVNQLKEILKMSSSNFEILTFNTTLRGLFQDLGDFLIFNLQIGSTSFDHVPCQIRDIVYQSSGTIGLTVWSYLMTPYPGYNSGSIGIVGGFDASITLT